MPVCDVCEKSFHDRSGLVRHSREVHAVRLSTQPPKKMVCYSCSSAFATNVQFVKHLSDEHNIEVVNENLSFESDASFVQWKQSIESSSPVKFVVRDRTKMKGKIVAYYRCIRDGFYQPQVSNSDRQRALKMQGSRKINAHCPARIKVSKFVDGKVDVNFISTHFGHELELAHVPISSHIKRQVAAKLACKIPLDHVLDGVRKMYGDMNRDSLLTKQDLHNIMRDFKLNVEYKQHSDDVSCVDNWVEKERQLNSPSCILFYKGKGLNDAEYPALRQQDFFLAVMTAGQQELLTEFGSDVICMDSTHGTTGNGYELTTILVVDDLGQAFPCAFCITNRNDSVGMRLFLSKVKEKVGIVLPRTFMSDVAEVFYNAWKYVMGESHFRLFCTWHVLRAWESDIHNKEYEIKSTDKKKQTSTVLRSLLMETDECAFQSKLPSIIKSLTIDEETTKFGQYFEKTYGKNYNSWAYCHRINANVNTNVNLEKMHGDLKHIFLGGRIAKHMDKTVHTLMRLINCKLFDRLVALKKEKLTFKMEALRLRHKTSLSLDFEKIVVPGMADPRGNVTTWTAFSSSGINTYTVSANTESCSCQIFCRPCNACIHKFSCTCIDSCINYNMCKHVHLVGQFLIADSCCKGPSYDANKEVQDTAVSLDPRPPLVKNSEKSELVKNLSANEQRYDDEAAIEEMKKATADDFKRLLEDVSSKQQVALIRKSLKTLVPQLQCMEGRKRQDQEREATPARQGARDRGDLDRKRKRHRLEWEQRRRAKWPRSASTSLATDPPASPTLP